ncbi:MAG: hypothetical protein NC093_00425 [Alistipes sp.]|nr:hypothetical protein [Alistipes sp.]
MNKKLMDQPGHGHYPYCAMRKKQIENSAVKILAFSSASGAVMLVCTLLGVPMGFFTSIASVVSGDSYMAFLAVSWLEIILTVLLAVMNFFRSKAYGIPVFFIYAALSVSVLHGSERTPTSMIPLLIGVVGFIVSSRVFFDFADQRQLEITEGYPFFSEIYTEQTKNPDYRSRYEDIRNPGILRKSAPDASAMQELSSAADCCIFPDVKNGSAAMNDLFSPAGKPEPIHEPSPETAPEIYPESEIAPKAMPEPEKAPELNPPDEKPVMKFDKSILETSTSLFDDDYELPSIKPLYFQRLEEEKKKQQQE